MADTTGFLHRKIEFREPYDSVRKCLCVVRMSIFRQQTKGRRLRFRQLKPKPWVVVFGDQGGRENE